MNDALEQIITKGACKITPALLAKLVRWLPEIRLAVTQIPDFPHLHEQVEFLAHIVEDFHSGLIKSIPYTSIAESAFALLCLRKRVDTMPDVIPGCGYADDAAIVAAVFETYQEPTLRRVLARRRKTTPETFLAG